MKIGISKSLKEGLEIINKNPLVYLPLFFISVVSYLSNLYLAGVMKNSLAQITESSQEFGITGLLSSLPWLKIIVITSIAGLVSFYLFLAAIRLIYDGINHKPSLNHALKVAIKKFAPLFVASIIIFLLNIAVIFLSVAVALLTGAIMYAFGAGDLAATIVMSFVGLVGFVFLMFLQLKFVFYPFVGIIEHEKTPNMIRKSWQLTRDNWWRLFALAILTMLVALLLFVLTTLVPNPVAAIAGLIIQILATGWALSVFTSAYLQIEEKHLHHA